MTAQDAGQAAESQTIEVSSADGWAAAVETAGTATQATTIQLAADVSVADAASLGNENAAITLDLNGHTLNMKNRLTATAGSVYIADSVGKGQLAFSDSSGYFRITKSSVNIAGATVTSDGSASLLVSVNGDGAALTIGTGALLDASNIASDKKGTAVDVQRGAVTMTGGTVQGAWYGLKTSGSSRYPHTVAISGGSVTGERYALYGDPGRVDVSGGVFTATGDTGVGIMVMTGLVSGGAFKSKVNSDGSDSSAMNGCPVFKYSDMNPDFSLAENVFFTDPTGPDNDGYYSVTAFEPASADAAKALDDAVASAKALDGSDYTAASWKALSDVIDAAGALTKYSYTDSEGNPASACEAQAVESATQAIADAQAGLVKARFGSDKVQLEQGTWALPLTMQKATSHSEASMAAECIKGAKVTVAEDGTATVTVDLQAVHFAGQTGYGDNWQVYPGDAPSGTSVSATALATNNDGHASQISFQVPDNGLDGVYVGMDVYIGSSDPVHQTAWFQLNWADASELATDDAVADLQAAVENAQKLGEGAYTASSYAALSKAVKSAQGVLNGSYPPAASVESAAKALADAQEALVESAQSISGKASFSKTYGDKAFSLGAKAKTALSYESSNAKVAAVDKNGKVTIKGAGTAKITVSATAADGYKAASKTVTVNVAKAAQKLKAKASAKTLKTKSLKKKAKAVKAIKVTGAKGKVSYKKASGSSKLSVNAKTGKVTVKKGTKKGTYQAKVKVSAKATANYKAASKTVTVKVKVK